MEENIALFSAMQLGLAFKLNFKLSRFNLSFLSGIEGLNDGVVLSEMLGTKLHFAQIKSKHF